MLYNSDEQIDFYKNKHILVAGVSGYLANNLIQSLESLPCRISRFAETGEPLSLHHSRCAVTDIVSNLDKIETWQAAVRDADVIFYFAGLPYHQELVSMPAWEQAEGSLRPLLALLEACRLYGRQPHFVFASTVTIADLQGENALINEQTTAKPRTCFALHKYLSETYIQFYTHQGAIKGTALRLANVYGPVIHRTALQTERGFLHEMLKKAIEGENLILYDDGIYYRDFLYITDAIQAFLLAGALSEMLQGQAWILGAGEAVTLRGVAECIVRQVQIYLQHSVLIESIPYPSASNFDKRHMRVDPAQFISKTGWHARIDLETGMMHTLQALL